MTADPSRPWEVADELDAPGAARLIAARWPELAAQPVRYAAAGWDNTVFRVGAEWVFRFPRREVAAGLLRHELAVLPRLAERLPLPVPEPVFVGEPGDDTPWPFYGARWLPGVTAVEARLDAAARTRAAPVLGAFLRALHGVAPDDCGAPQDAHQRMVVEVMEPKLLQRVRQLEELGELDDAGMLLALIAAAHGLSLREDVTCHGDLYARQFLVDSRGVPTAVIDWGDVHRGEPAGDLAVAYGFLPPSARPAFFDAYGPVDERTVALARLKAGLHAAATLLYALDVGDDDLAWESRVALEHAQA